MISNDAGSWCDRERQGWRFSRLRVGREPWRVSWLSVANERRVRRYWPPSPSTNRILANSCSSRLTTYRALWPPRSALSLQRDCIRHEAHSFKNLFPVRHLLELARIAEASSFLARASVLYY